MKKIFKPIFLGIFLVFFAVIISDKLGLYEKIQHFDKVLHFTGGFLVGWITWLFYQKELTGTHYLKKFILILAGTALLGLGWEFTEYTSSGIDYYTELDFTHYLYIGTIHDTVHDLVLDLIGGTLAALYFLRRR